MINGNTTLIAHIGYPTSTFKSPMIYNPWFDKHGIDAVVVPMGVKPEHYAQFLKALFKTTNVRGALITMPHKVVTMDLVDELTPTAQVAGAANAVLCRADGTLLGDQFDGAGFVRGVLRKGQALRGKRVLVSGNGGVGCAIAASLADAGVAEIALYDSKLDAATVDGDAVVEDAEDTTETEKHFEESQQLASSVMLAKESPQAQVTRLQQQIASMQGIAAATPSPSQPDLIATPQLAGGTTTRDVAQLAQTVALQCFSATV